MQTQYTEQRNKSQSCFKNSEFALMSFRCNKSQDKFQKKNLKKQKVSSSSKAHFFLRKKFIQKKEIKGTNFFNFKQCIEKSVGLNKRNEKQQQSFRRSRKGQKIDIFDNLTQKNKQQEQIFFKSKREAKFFDLFMEKNKKLKINQRMSSRCFPDQDEDDYDTDEEILVKSVEKIIGLLRQEIHKRNSNFKFNQFSFLEFRNQVQNNYFQVNAIDKLVVFTDYLSILSSINDSHKDSLSISTF